MITNAGAGRCARPWAVWCVAIVCAVIGGWSATSARVSADAAVQASAASVAGAWSGQISLPPGPLNIEVTLASDAPGGWSGTIDIPAQGAKGVALSSITVDGRAVSFAMAGVPGEPRFSGTLSDDDRTVSGTFTQSGGSFPFELRRLLRPQEPKPPFPYRADDVSYRNDAAGVSIAGTLTLPEGAGPFPAVLLISGSGPQDRDSKVFGHKPFLLWADTLTRQGIAVLRVDDRGVGGTDRGAVQPTTLDFAGDARAGLTFLSTRPEIDPKRIGLIGHSEGANIAAIVAADDPRVRFIVMLAGYGVRGDEAMMQQVDAITTAQELPRPVIEWDLAMRRGVYDQILAEKDGQPDQAARQALVESVPPVPGMADATAARQTAMQLLNVGSTRWWRFMLAHDMAATLHRVTVPVLALVGELDLQVLAGPNVPAIRAALEVAGNTDATVRAMPKLNHLFQTAKTGMPDEYEQIEETISPSVLSLVAEWVGERVR